jgi:hypothetical protein
MHPLTRLLPRSNAIAALLMLLSIALSAAAVNVRGTDPAVSPALSASGVPIVSEVAELLDEVARANRNSRLLAAREPDAGAAASVSSVPAPAPVGMPWYVEYRTAIELGFLAIGALGLLGIARLARQDKRRRRRSRRYYDGTAMRRVDKVGG